MKRKRIGSFLLALVLTFSLIPSLAVGASAATIDESYNTGMGKGGGGGALNSSIFSSAVVQNTSASSSGSGTAKSLEVVVKLKNFSSKNSVYALVMKASDYGAFVQTAGGPQSAGIDSTTYFQQSKFDSNYYAIGRKNPNAGTAGETISLPLVIASTENASALGADKLVSNKTMPVATVASDNYFDEHVLVVFSTEVASNDNYYVDRFYVDADGYVRTPSYLIRYNANNPAGTGSAYGTPTRTIIRALPGGTLAESTTLSTANLTRTGYTFLGWSKTARTASADLTVSDTDYAAGASYPKPGMLYTVNDLHAVWKTIPVVFGKVGGSKNQTVANEVRVGVTFSQTFDLDDAVSDGTKNYQVTQVTVGGTPTSDSTKFPNNIPAGMKLERSGTKQWILSGTPAYDCDKPIVMTVEVTDQSNNTKDTMLLTISKIEKGLQPSPDLDVNTGLGTQMVTEGEAPNTAEVGQIIGFYSAGQESKKDSANTGMTDGTGTYTNYYLSKGMIYEYRPAGDGNAPWRAIPAPKSYYNLTDETAKAAFAEALKVGSAGNVVTTKVVAGASVYSIELVTAWTEAYGAIRFVNGIPVVTGLAKDAEYEIRFRENATYDASTPTKITVGGAASAGTGSGPTLSVHLLGGYVEDDISTVDVDEAAVFRAFMVACAAAKANDTVMLSTEITPKRAGYNFGGWQLGTLDPITGEVAYTALSAPEGTATISIKLEDKVLTVLPKWNPVADPSAYTPVVLYDWNGTTLLLSFAVSKTATPAELQKTLAQATTELMSQENAAAYLGDSYSPEESYYDASFILTAKKGYTFGKWINLNSDGATSYGDAVVVSNNGVMTTIAEPEDATLDATVGYIALKASYSTNEDIKPLSAAGFEQRRYQVALEKGTVFNSSNMSLTLSVTRQNGDNVGVHRCRTPGIRVQMQLESGAIIYSLLTLENVDHTTVEIVPNTAATKVSAEVVDINNVINWVADTASRSNAYSINLVSSDETTGYKAEAYVGQLCEYAIAGKSTLASNFNNAEITVSAGNVYGTTLTTAAQLRTQAMKNILAALRMKNSGATQAEMAANLSGTKYLSHSEAAIAVKEGTYSGDKIDGYYP